MPAVLALLFQASLAWAAPAVEQNLRAPKPVESLAAVKVQETLGAISQASLESKQAALLDLMEQAQEDLDEPASSAGHLERVTEGLASLLQRNVSEKIADEFVSSMTKTLDAYQEMVPDNTPATNAHLKKLLKHIYKCEADYKTGLFGAEQIYGDATPEKEDVHEDCRSAEAQKRSQLDACRKAEAELKQFQAEDPMCAQWPVLKNMKSETAAKVCHEQMEGKTAVVETYEQYLQRLRNEVDSQLMIYRQLKNACASSDAKPPGCKSEEIALQQRKELCDVQQAHLEKTSCQHARTVSKAWNTYAQCWTTNTDVYKTEVKRASEFVAAQRQSYMASKQIECLLSGFKSDNAKATAKMCKEERTKLEGPKRFELSVACPPAIQEAPKELPNYPGSGGYRKDVYDDVAKGAPAVKSINCPVEKMIDVPKEKVDMQCDKKLDF